MCDCDSPDPIFDSTSSEEICQRCGVVLETILYDGSEWTFDDFGRDTSHVGQPGTKLGTTLDAAGKVSKRIMAASMDRADLADREHDALVDGLCRSLAISSTVISSTAKDMFRMHTTSKKLCGESKIAAAAACVYYACRAERVNRELRFVSSVCQVDMRAMNFAAKSVKDTLRTSMYADKIAEPNNGVEALVDVFLDRLRLRPDDRKTLWRETTKTLRNAGHLFDSGRKPRTIIGGVIYVTVTVLKMDVPKKHIMEAAGVCAQTLDKITTLIHIA